MAPEEREQQRADVRAVHVGVGHEHDAVVAKLVDAERLAEPAAERHDQVLDLLVAEDLVGPRLLDVEDLAAQRQDRLVAALARLLGGAACGQSLDDEDLAVRRVALAAVDQLAGQRRRLEQ